MCNFLLKNSFFQHFMQFDSSCTWVTLSHFILLYTSLHSSGRLIFYTNTYLPLHIDLVDIWNQFHCIHEGVFSDILNDKCNSCSTPDITLLTWTKSFRSLFPQNVVYIYIYTHSSIGTPVQSHSFNRTALLQRLPLHR